MMRKLSSTSVLARGLVTSTLLSLVPLIIMMLCITTTTTTSAWYITVPTSTNDWKQLATLYVESFDEPGKFPSTSITTMGTSNTPINKDNDYREKFEDIIWRGFEKGWTERYTYQRYVKTARRMRGTKYALVIVKDNGTSDRRMSREDSDQGGSKSKVVGMAELGLTMDQNIQRGTLQPRPTIGVLCVGSDYHTLGIGRALVERCETLVTELWKDCALYAEVEPTNIDAIKFFKRCGYERCGGAEDTVTVTITRRRQVEECEHFLFRKSLISSAPASDEESELI